MKPIISLFLTLSILFSLLSCGKPTAYTDRCRCTDLADRAIDSFDRTDAYATADELFFNDYFHLPDYTLDYTVRFASDSGNLNEIGVFHTEAGRAKELQTLLQTYLQTSYQRNRTWYDSYIPHETPKLRDAEIRVFGNYVVYTVLSGANKDRVFFAVESALTAPT